MAQPFYAVIILTVRECLTPALAIVGGAVIPLIFGTIVDAVSTTEQAVVANYQTAYWIMVPCYLFILYFAVSGHKIRTK